MTFLVFIVVLLLGGWHWLTMGYFIVGEVPIYPVMFVATLATATVGAIVSRETRCVVAAAVLIASFVAHFWAWTRPDPVLTLAILNIVVAAYFLLMGARRWELIIGGLYLVSFVIGLATVSGILPNAEQRADLYIAFSHPDLVAICGHLANVTLGAGAGDGGKRVRQLIGRRIAGGPMGLALGYRIALALRRGGKIAED